jgi:hypothetical protein
MDGQEPQHQEPYISMVLLAVNMNILVPNLLLVLLIFNTLRTMELLGFPGQAMTTQHQEPRAFPKLFQE